MRTGRPKTPLILTEDERQQLTSLAHRSRTAAGPARRARIILACADGLDNKAVGRRLHVSQTTVCKWRARFVDQRLAGLYDEPRPGAPRQITDAQVEDVIVRTLETTPRGATRSRGWGSAVAAGECATGPATSTPTAQSCRRSPATPPRSRRHSLPSTRSTTQHPRTCGCFASRQWFNTSSLSHPAS